MKLQDALEKVFQANLKKPEFRLYKHRYSKGKLSLDKQEEILTQHGYIKSKEAVWRRQS